MLRFGYLNRNKKLKRRTSDRTPYTTQLALGRISAVVTRQNEQVPDNRLC